ncbi:MAG: hypothetical protein AAFV53_10860, partial [Myxococcota bacterium]
MATGTTDDEAVLVWMLQILHQAARFEQNLPIDNGVDREAMRAAGVGQYSLPRRGGKPAELSGTQQGREGLGGGKGGVRRG